MGHGRAAAPEPGAVLRQVPTAPSRNTLIAPQVVGGCGPVLAPGVVLRAREPMPAVIVDLLAASTARASGRRADILVPSGDPWDEFITHLGRPSRRKGGAIWVQSGR